MSRLPYSPGIDGLRAIAVAAVVAYHLDKSWAVGGFLGVEVFLVISGFLITALMLAEHNRTDRIDLKAFWRRRAMRLLPALFLVIAGVTAYMAVVLPDELIDIRGEVIAALVYVTNWFLTFSNESYFEALGRPSPLRHLWSLALEEQWYLIWPLVFAFLLRITRGRLIVMGALISGAALASAGLMAFLYDPNIDPSRIYYGTDTRASGLLLGAVLALVWSPWKLSPNLRTGGRIGLDVAAVGGLAGLLVLFWQLDEFSSSLYQGGFLVVGLLTCATIIGAVHPSGTLVSKVLAWRPLVWLGTRSYGLYLWHWPVIVFSRSRVDVDMSGWQLDLARIGLSLLLAEVSFRLVEQPIRSGALGRLGWRLRLARPPDMRLRRITGFATVALIGASVTLGVRLAQADAADVVPATTADVADLLATSAAVTAPTTTVGPTTATTATGSPTTSALADTAAPTSNAPTRAAQAATAPATTASATTAPSTTTTTEARLPRRVDVTGDSVATTMNINFPSDLVSSLTVNDAAIEGCGVIEEGSMLSGGRARRNFSACVGFADRWAATALRNDAEVVLVVIGAWEVFDLRVDGEDVAFGTPRHDEIISTGINKGVDALLEAGMQVALLEVPCFFPVDGGGLRALPERGEVERSLHLNELLANVAANDDNVHMIKSPPEFCTDPAIGSDTGLRWDGVHYGPRGGAFVWARLLDQLLAIPVDYPTPTTAPEAS